MYSPQAAEAEHLISLMEAAHAAGTPTVYKTELAVQVNEFMGNNAEWLKSADAFDSFGFDYATQLETGYVDLTGEGVGSAANPNKYTTSAAKMKDDSVSKQVFSSKFAEDLREGIGPAFAELGKGLTKGLGSTALKLAAAAGVFGLIYLWIQKRGAK